MNPLTSLEYHSLYKWAFSFALESETQRTLSVEIASQLWKVVFSPDEPPILDFWLSFLESSADSLRGISRDTWNLFLIFVRRCAHDLSTYDETEAWPSLFDDFVHFHNDQTNQNCSKSPWDGAGSGNVISSPWVPANSERVCCEISLASIPRWIPPQVWDRSVWYTKHPNVPSHLNWTAQIYTFFPEIWRNGHGRILANDLDGYVSHHLVSFPFEDPLHESRKPCRFTEISSA